MKISVIIPAYNHSRYLSEAILSAQNSANCEVEVIVINDGSTDETEIVARSFSNVRYFYQPNLGAHAAINFGIRQASNDHIAILNDDDVLSINYLFDAANTMRLTGAHLVATSPELLGVGTK